MIHGNTLDGNDDPKLHSDIVRAVKAWMSRIDHREGIQVEGVVGHIRLHILNRRTDGELEACLARFDLSGAWEWVSP